VFKESSLSAIVVDEPQPTKSIAAIHVVKAGTKLGLLYYPKYELTEFGKPTAVDPGEYDLVCKTAGGGTFTLVKGLSVKQQTAFINPNAIVGTIVVEPLTLKAFPKLNELTVVASEGGRFICQQTRTFGTALPIIPGKYDLECVTSDEAKFTLAMRVEVKPMAVTRIVADREVAAIVVRDPKLEGLTVKRILLLKAGTNLIKHEAKRFDVPIMVDADESYDVLLEQASGSTTFQKGVKPKRVVVTTSLNSPNLISSGSGRWSPTGRKKRSGVIH